ncbi:MAG TPA: HEPN domain-containing protein [Planctomycetota bacterium]|nr:HEPN domain-containing protein [Planctomycetota bacterium]
MSAELLIGNLLRVAKEDLDGARTLSSAGNRNAIYLCEQAAEKIIRAVLTSEGKHAGIKHHLNEMVDLVPDVNPLKPALREIEHLGAFATSYRYPTPVGRIVSPPARRVFDENAAKVDTVLKAAISGFKVDLSQPNTPAGNATPIR